MKWTDRIRQVKIVLVVIAILMAVASVMVSHRLTRDLEAEERNKMGVWAEAMRSLTSIFSIIRTKKIRKHLICA